MSHASTRFEPDPQRVREFDTRMRTRLAESLRYLHNQCAPHVDLDETRLKNGLGTILGGPVMPDTFAAYYELVFAIDSGETGEIVRLFDEVLSPRPAAGPCQIIPFNDPSIDPRSQRYLRPVDSDPNLPFAIRPVDGMDFQHAGRLIAQSFELLRTHAPELHAEIEALLSVIMIGAGPREKGAYTFDGASAFELWGAILLNAIEAKDVVDMVQTLAHESCHVMLFGFCIDGNLVLNPDDELYRSPLRIDPRPIDGIYHATFVLARMHYACEVLEKCRNLSPELRAKVAREKKQRAASFFDGLSTLKAHARCTPEGQALIASAEAYMNQSEYAPAMA